MRKRHSTPVVVVGGSLNALGVVRSLAQGRMPIYVLETTRQCPAVFSRHSRYAPAVALSGPELVRALQRLAGRLPSRPVLILTSDQHVMTISEHRSEIEVLYRISLPAAEVVHALADKVLFQQLAEREGFAVPRSVCLARSDNPTQLDALTPPLVLKPADKTLVLKGMAERAVLSSTTAEAVNVARQMLRGVPRVIVQEWIPGPDTEIFFALFTCDSNGRLLALFPGRKLVCVPPTIGGTAVCVAAPEVAAELAASTREFIERVEYRGLGSLEFKRNAATGRFMIIEPTVGRTDWQEEIATLCGVNLPLATYLAELNLAVPSHEGNYRAVAWRSSAGFRAFVTPGTAIVDGYFRWLDPMPGLWEYGFENKIFPLWRKAVKSLRGPPGG
jgi:D-aspartate ligase